MTEDPFTYALNRCLRALAAPTLASITVNCDIGLTRRSDFRYLLAQARSSGMEILDEHDGGWLSRRHIVRFRGSLQDVTDFETFLRRWVNEMNAYSAAMR